MGILEDSLQESEETTEDLLLRSAECLRTEDEE